MIDDDQFLPKMLTLVELCINFFVKNQELINESKLPQELIIKLYDSIATSFLFNIKVIKRLENLIDRISPIKDISDGSRSYIVVNMIELINYGERLEDHNPFLKDNFKDILIHLMNDAHNPYNSIATRLFSFIEAIKMIEIIIDKKISIHSFPLKGMLDSIAVWLAEFRSTAILYRRNYDKLMDKVTSLKSRI